MTDGSGRVAIDSEEDILQARQQARDAAEDVLSAQGFPTN